MEILKRCGVLILRSDAVRFWPCSGPTEPERPPQSRFSKASTIGTAAKYPCWEPIPPTGTESYERRSALFSKPVRWTPF